MFFFVWSYDCFIAITSDVGAGAVNDPQSQCISEELHDIRVFIHPSPLPLLANFSSGSWERLLLRKNDMSG